MNTYGYGQADGSLALHRTFSYRFISLVPQMFEQLLRPLTAVGHLQSILPPSSVANKRLNAQEDWHSFPLIQDVVNLLERYIGLTASESLH